MKQDGLSYYLQNSVEYLANVLMKIQVPDIRAQVESLHISLENIRISNVLMPEIAINYESN